jgi:hypothetical protein
MPLLTILLAAGAAPAETVDKSGYHLLNPTPRQHMRPMSPDRPDTTESPYTVDAGHVQLEASFVDYTFDDRTGAREETETWVFGATNLKLGLTNNIDLQFVFDAWTNTNTFDETGAGGSSRADGFGDVQLRAKINLFGNDGGDWAMAVMPWIQLPVGEDELSSDHVEGGLIIPLATELPGGWSLGVMGEVDFVYDEDDDDYDTELLHTLALGHDLVGDLAGYVEYIGVLTTDSDTDYIAVLGAGLTWALNDDVQLDVGANFGLTRSADDVQVFTGITWRF